MTLPAYLQNLPSRNLAQTAIANVGAGSPPSLSIQGGRFTLIDIAGNAVPIQTLHVDVVIIDVNTHVSKIFYGVDKPWDPNNPAPPLCFSDNGIAPSMGAGAPQSPTCASCPQNVWGSKVSAMGSAVKQCADQQKIAVFVPEYSDGLFLLRIPPGSFANWRSYMAKFAGAGLDPDRVITRISFPEPNTLGFQSPGYITEQQVGVVAKMIDAKAADMMIGKLDKPREAALPAPQPQENGQWTQPQTAPVAPPAAPAPLTLASAQTSQPSPDVFGGPAQPAALVQAAVQQPAQQPAQRRRRRTQAEIQAANQAQAGQQPAQPVQAPFRPDAPPASRQDAAPNPPQGQFGIVQNPPGPPPGLDLDAVFK